VKFVSAEEQRRRRDHAQGIRSTVIDPDPGVGGAAAEKSEDRSCEEWNILLAGQNGERNDCATESMGCHLPDLPAA
jgi:hypothetical protein